MMVSDLFVSSRGLSFCTMLLFHRTIAAMLVLGALACASGVVGIRATSTSCLSDVSTDAIQADARPCFPSVAQGFLLNVEEAMQDEGLADILVDAGECKEVALGLRDHADMLRSCAGGRGAEHGRGERASKTTPIFAEDGVLPLRFWADGFFPTNLFSNLGLKIREFVGIWSSRVDFGVQSAKPSMTPKKEGLDETHFGRYNQSTIYGQFAIDPHTLGRQPKVYFHRRGPTWDMGREALVMAVWAAGAATLVFTQLIASHVGEASAWVVKKGRGLPYKSILFWGLLLGLGTRVDAVTCHTCYDQCPGCTGGASCPFLTTPAANRVVVTSVTVAAGAATVVNLVNLLPLKFLRVIRRGHNRLANVI